MKYFENILLINVACYENEKCKNATNFSFLVEKIISEVLGRVRKLSITLVEEKLNLM